MRILEFVVEVLFSSICDWQLTLSLCHVQCGKRLFFPCFSIVSQDIALDITWSLQIHWVQFKLISVCVCDEGHLLMECWLSWAPCHK